MKLLITFCNNPNYHYAILDTETKQVTANRFEWPGVGGLTGIERYKDLYMIGVQSTPAGILCLDLNFRIAFHIGLIWTTDIHDIRLIEGSLFLVSTGNNSLYKFNFDSGETLHWTCFGNLWDQFHLNSFCFHGNRPLVSMFGERESGVSWRNISSGQIAEIGVEPPVIQNVGHPHSLLSIKDTLWYCESYYGAVCNDKGDEINIGGYTRGLVHHEDKFYVGVSYGRNISRSTGEEINEPITDEERCGIAIVTKDGRVLDFIDLSEYSTEIYGIHICEG